MLLSDTTKKWTMSTRARLTLATTTLGAIGIVIFVHRQQTLDKAVCFQLLEVSILAPTELSTGHASRCYPRYGAATHQARETAGLRDATTAGRRVS